MRIIIVSLVNREYGLYLQNCKQTIMPSINFCSFETGQRSQKVIFRFKINSILLPNLQSHYHKLYIESRK